MVYTGKHDPTAGLGQAQTVVIDLADDLLGCHRTVVVDNFFAKNFNLQHEFKNYWQQHHPHKPLSSSTLINYSTSICEAYSGIQPNNPWRLQDSVAYKLNRWLDKRETKSPFDIGLDLRMKHLNSKEIEHRQTSIKYTAADCLSMQQIMININIIDPQQSSNLLNETCILTIEQCISSIELLENNNALYTTQYDSMTHSPEPIVSPSILTQSTTRDWELISSNEDESTYTRSTSRKLKPVRRKTNELHSISEELSAKEHHKIHNRSCTLRQRKYYHAHTITVEDIYPRFGIRQIKSILKEHNIEFRAVNATTSKKTNKTYLYIGITDPNNLVSYQTRTRNLFTNQNYYAIRRQQRRTRFNDNRMNPQN
ncbi:unnamed protein product [Rotaria sordida]|uniref:Uncharacterized protein n=1 Tax=Rotaria sordida TaxID=392033 RepID=A0A815K007_9BILA|nr:unnamed protein product [Rotaria sordida]